MIALTVTDYQLRLMTQALQGARNTVEWFIERADSGYSFNAMQLHRAHLLVCSFNRMRIEFVARAIKAGYSRKVVAEFFGVTQSQITYAKRKYLCKN